MTAALWAPTQCGTCTSPYGRVNDPRPRCSPEIHPCLALASAFQHYDNRAGAPLTRDATIIVYLQDTKEVSTTAAEAWLLSCQQAGASSKKA